MFISCTKNGLHWQLQPGFEKDLPENIPSTPEECRRDPRATLIRDNNVRMSFLYRAADGPELFIKRYKCRSAWDTVKYFFLPAKAAAEWRNLLRFREKGLPSSAPLAVGEKRSLHLLRDSCLVTASLSPAVALNEFLTDAKLTFQQRRLLCLALARLVRRLHDQNVFFRDLHAGNVLIYWHGKKNPELHLIDLHKAFFLPGLLERMRVRDLGQLCNSLSASRTESIRFLKIYCKGKPGAYYRNLQKAIYQKRQRLEAVRLKSRSKRCTRNSSVFEKRRTWEESYFGRKDFGKAAAEAAIGQHLAGRVGGGAGLLKTASKSMVTVHELDGFGQVCVKGYLQQGLWYSLKYLFRKSRALKSWIAGNSLLVRGIETPRPLAVLERTSGPLRKESFLITRLLPGARELNQYVLAAGLAGARKREFIQALAAALRNMHGQGVYHADMKSNNILVQEDGGGWRFSLIDLDRTYFSAIPDFDRRANNLAQINASVAAAMTPRDRLRFFYFYARGTALHGERKKYYRAILAISRTKNTAPYGVLFS